MTPNELYGIVSSINDDLMLEPVIEDFLMDLGSWVNFSSDGYYQVIEFMGITLWNDDDDMREYDEEEDDYEPLEPFLRKRINSIMQTLSLIKLKIEEEKI